MSAMEKIKVDNESIDLMNMGWADKAVAMCEAGRLVEAMSYEQYIWASFRTLGYAVGRSHPSTAYAHRMYLVARNAVGEAMQRADSLHTTAEPKST